MASNNSILKDRAAAAQGAITGRSYGDIAAKEPTIDKEQAKIAKVITDVKAKINTQYRDRILTESKDPKFVLALQESIERILEKEPNVDTVLKRKSIAKQILDDILGFGPLQELLEDPKVTEIMVSNWQRTYVERGGRLVLDNDVQFINDDQLRTIIDKIVQPIGRRIDELNPLVDARLPDGSRVNATIPPISPDGCTLTIRKFSKSKLTGHDYLKFGSLSPQMLEFLEGAIIARANIIVSGGTGSGKTTLLNMLSNYVPGNESIVTVEDSCELQLYQDNVRRLEAKPANNEGKGEVAIRDLVKNCLRMRPDRIIVGEIRDGAIVDMFRAMSSGHDGSLTTIHSNSPRDLVDSTIFILFGMSDMKFTEKAIQQLVCSAVDLIVQISRLADGSRKIMNITHVVGYGKVGGKILDLKDENIETDKIYLKDVYKFVQDDVDEKTNKIIGHFAATGYRPKAIIQKALANRHKMRDIIFDPNFEMKEEDVLDLGLIAMGNKEEKPKEEPTQQNTQPVQQPMNNGMPQQNFGNAMPQPTFPMGGVPQQGYSMPQQGYGVPQQPMNGMPQQGYGMPQQGYNNGMVAPNFPMNNGMPQQ